MPEVLRLPGLIDPHVHLREPGATWKEDFETGTMAALVGGVTMVADMPNNPKPTISSEALREKIDLATGRVYCDIGFYLGAVAEGVQPFEEVIDQVFGLKIYMNHTTGPLLVDDPQQLRSVFQRWPRRRPILVHAEGQTLEKAISLASLFGQRLHVCHVALEDEILMIRAAKEAGIPVTCEVSAHHLFLSDDDVAVLGPFGIMRPPLGTTTDRQALWDNLAVIDCIASDHAPHTQEEKLDSPKPPFGVPGLETTLPLMLTAVAEERLTLDRLVEMTSTRPRQIFGIGEQPDTYAEVDIAESYTINSANLQTKSGWTPFDGHRVRGQVRRVVLRGEVVFDGENIVGEPRGKVIYPNNNYE